jgi:DNA-binding PadR family transcriptional regulator
MSERPTPVETHLLIALQGGASYGYALMQEIEVRSGGELSPDIGSMYRTLARLMERGWVREAPTPDEAATSSRGRPRRYYGLTEAGGEALRHQVQRMRAMIELADRVPRGLRHEPGS